MTDQIKLYWFDVKYTMDGKEKEKPIYAESKKDAAEILKMIHKPTGEVIRIISVRLNR